MGMPIDVAETKERLGPAGLEVRFAPETFDEKARTVEFVMATEVPVRRYGYRSGVGYVPYDEILSMKPEHVRLERFASGRAPFVEQHDRWNLDSVLGSIVPGSIRFAGGKMFGRVLFHETERARELAGRVQRGELPNASIAYQVHAYDVTEPERRGDVEKRLAVDWEPHECSLVSIPADPGAYARAAESLHTCVVRRAAGQSGDYDMPEETIVPDTKTTTRGADQSTPAGATTAPAVDPAERQRREAEIREEGAKAERARVAAILDACRKASLPDAFARKLVEGGKSIDEARAAIIDEWSNSRGADDEIASGYSVGNEDRTKQREAVERAILHRSNPRKFKLESQDEGRFRGMSLLEIGEYCRELAGLTHRRGLTSTERAQQLFGREIGFGMRAGGMHGTSDFPAIMANVLNKVLRAAYKESPSTWQPLARDRGVSDFKPIQVTQLGESPKLLPISEGAEYLSGTVGEGKETYQVLKYGRKWALTWEAIINDDLDALTRVPTGMGRQVANLESDLFWAIFTGNPVMGDGVALFHASHANLVAGAIGTTSLNLAMLAMRKQKGLDGETHLAIPMRHLIVPVELETVANQQVVLQTVPTTAAETRPFQGKLNVISEIRLGASSTTEWYAASSPEDVDLIEHAFLRDYVEPTFEYQEGFDVDGQAVKIRHVTGFKAIDHRGLVKSTG